MVRSDYKDMKTSEGSYELVNLQQLSGYPNEFLMV